MADVLKTSLDERDYEKQAAKTVVLYNIEETSRPVESDVNDVFQKLQQDPNLIVNARRLGSKKDASSRPRPIEVQVPCCEFDMRKIMPKTGSLKGKRIFVKPKLLWRDRLLEKSLLAYRYNLIQNGFKKQLFRIRDLKLFYNVHEIDTSNDIQATIGQLSNLSPPAN